MNQSIMNGDSNKDKNTRQPKSWFKRHQFLLLRRCSQIAILLMFTLPLGNVWLLKGSLASSQILSTIPLSDPYIFLQSLLAGNIYTFSGILGVILITIFYFCLGGRSYCAWVCPINIVTDLAHYLRAKTNFRNHLFLPKKVRFWLMILVLLLSLITHTIVWELVNPITGIMRSFMYFSFGLSNFATLFVLSIFLLDVVVSNRLWCGYLCPVGAFYKLLGEKSPLKINAFQQSACDDCADCYKVCPEMHVIKPALKTNNTLISDGDCSRCGRCVDICHTNVFKFEWQIKPTEIKLNKTKDTP